MVIEFNKDGSIPFEEFPWRIFLDTSVLQILQDYGEFIWDGGDIPPDDKIRSIPNGDDNLFSLHGLFRINTRVPFEIALSKNSIKEVYNRGRHDYLQWAYEMLDYWDNCINSYKSEDLAFSGIGIGLSQKTQDRKFGHLSEQDKLLIKDALMLECKGFLTMDLKLAKNSGHIEKELNILVITPKEFWELFKPWAPLFY